MLLSVSRRAKLEEMQIQMARNAADTINGLKTEAAAVEYLTYANEQLRNAALGAAEAELEAAVVNARRRGGSQAEAASQIYQGYQAAKQFIFFVPLHPARIQKRIMLMPLSVLWRSADGRLT